MKVILKNRLVNDQILATVGAEVSALLNTRPLTYLSVDPVDPDPLTPNHFLHAGTRPYTPLRFVDIASTSAPEKQFKYSQEVVEHRRWIISLHLRVEESGMVRVNLSQWATL